MAFSEHLLGLSLIATPIILTTGNALLAYNVAFFLSFPLCALGAHVLVYQITRRHDVALVAGIAYGFAPYRMAQFAHVQVLSSYWIPLALLGLHLFVQRPRGAGLALFAVVLVLPGARLRLLPVLSVGAGRPVADLVRGGRNPLGRVRAAHARVGRGDRSRSCRSRSAT